MKERRRILFVSCGIFALFSFLIVQFFRVQIIQENKWSRFAKAQHELIVKEPFKRGIFYSNLSIGPQKNHPPQPLVMDIPMFHLFVDPHRIPESKRFVIAAKLNELLEGDEEKKQFITSQLELSKSHSRKVEMWLTQKRRNEVLNWWYSFAGKNKLPSNAVYFLPDYKRSYPFGSLCGQLLHTIQENKDEVTKQGIPTGGLEYYFNELLKGKEGKRKILRSPKHPLDLGEVIEKPVNGADIYLTINHHLQAIAEEELKKGVEQSKAKAGWAILMDPYTGEIWAMAQYPPFFPERYKDYYNDPETIEKTRLKAVVDCYEPGSILKPFTIAACFLANEELERRGKSCIFNPFEKVSTLSGRFPGRAKDLGDDHRTFYHMNMYHAIQKSANIYMARMAERIIGSLGNEWYRQQLYDKFGFGKLTGIEYPLEAPGLLPEIGKHHANGTLEWSVPTPFSLAIGHNLLLNGMQIVRAYSVLANGGFLVRPTFIRKIVKKDPYTGEEVISDLGISERSRSFPRVLTAEKAEKIRYAMCYVGRDGGAKKGSIFGYTSAVKSGTANKIIQGEYSKKSFFSSFVGIVPATRPKFVLLVSLDEPEVAFYPGIGYTYYGSKCVAPIFREISCRALQYLGVPPDDPHNYPPGDPRHNPEKMFLSREIAESNDLYEKWNVKK